MAPQMVQPQTTTIDVIDICEESSPASSVIEEEKGHDTGAV
jgi:hypothetical protein